MSDEFKDYDKSINEDNNLLFKEYINNNIN